MEAGRGQAPQGSTSNVAPHMSLPPPAPPPQVVGCYVGFATVGAFATWYTRSSFMGIDLSGDGHTPITLAQLRSWEDCPNWKGFEVGREARVQGAA